MQNELFIRLPNEDNWRDAFLSYGVVMEETSLSNLMTPAPAKEFVENMSDLQDGKRVSRDINDARKDERNVTFIIHLIANDAEDMMLKYGLFCSEILDKGFFDIKTKYQSDVIYRMTFLACTQFTEYLGGYAKFSLSLNEPDPTNRGLVDKWASE